MVADPETTPEIGDLSRPPELVAAARDEPGEAHDRLRLRVEVGQLRAHVDMHAEHIEPEIERLGDHRPRLRGRQAELRAVVAGADRLVGVRVDAERDAHEHARDTRRRREPGLVGRVEDDRSNTSSR